MTTGPTWTRARLAATLGECYGWTPEGKVDVDVVAAEMGLKPDTIRKWLRGADAARARISAKRLRELTTGGPRVELKADGKITVARDAIARIALPHGVGIIPPWRQREWLDPHFVLLIELYDRPWLQLFLTKRGNAADLARQKGTVVDQAVVRTKFHGDILVREAMRRQDGWAVRPSKNQLSEGRGQVWAADAPALDISALAVELDLAVGPGEP